MNRTVLRCVSRPGIAVVVAATLLAACVQTPKPVTVSEVIEASAVVEAIDRTTRQVRLRGVDGRTIVVLAGPSVRNLDRVNVGDRVTMRYSEAVAAEVVKPGMVTGATAPTLAIDRALTGERPGGSDTITLRGTVRVVSVDTVANTVDVADRDGVIRRIRVRDAGAQAFIRGLKPGDDVQLTFTEALAVAVEPAR